MSHHLRVGPWVAALALSLGCAAAPGQAKAPMAPDLPANAHEPNGYEQDDQEGRHELDYEISESIF